jgi:hypothetical protein
LRVQGEANPAAHAATSATLCSLSQFVKQPIALKHNMFTRPIIRFSAIYRRGLATHAGLGPNTSLPAVLHLKSGQSFTGKSFGAPRSIYGETVFSTSITSCALPPLYTTRDTF